jgi:hypothetical protein
MKRTKLSLRGHDYVVHVVVFQGLPSGISAESIHVVTAACCYFLEVLNGLADDAQFACGPTRKPDDPWLAVKLKLHWT